MLWTRRTTVGRVWWWRVRRSPLRRRHDVVEAWVMLALWCLGGLLGTVAGLRTADALEHGVARARATRRPVTAVLTGNAPRQAPAGARGSEQDQVWAMVRWRDTDGRTHRGAARVEPGREAGAPVRVWTTLDGGRKISEPVTVSDARLQVALVAAPAGMSAAAALLGAGRLVGMLLDRRRMDAWGAQWERIGPLWARRAG
ncbi:hypothetical protein ACIREE_39180 [Streptomyces sp. NPDC102467]|uniref:Rv1733c family protein n=1 Tax=Streptomyces sp. NPDC102467 TaxID=3366179 RepID=UPI003807FA96